MWCLFWKMFNREKMDLHDALGDATATHDIFEKINKENRETYVEALLRSRGPDSLSIRLINALFTIRCFCLFQSKNATNYRISANNIKK